MNKFQWNFDQNPKFFVQENSFENVVCEMATVLSRRDGLKTFPVKDKNCILDSQYYGYWWLVGAWSQVINSNFTDLFSPVYFHFINIRVNTLSVH